MRGQLLKIASPDVMTVTFGENREESMNYGALEGILACSRDLKASANNGVARTASLLLTHDCVSWRFLHIRSRGVESTPFKPKL